MAIEDEMSEIGDVWYTPWRVKKLLALMKFHPDRPPRLRSFEDIALPARAYRNPNEWWWGVRGDLLGALDRIESTRRTIVELCVLSDMTQERVAGLLGMSQGTVSKRLDQAYEDIAVRLGWVECSDD